MPGRSATAFAETLGYKSKRLSSPIWELPRQTEPGERQKWFDDEESTSCVGTRLYAHCRLQSFGSTTLAGSDF